VASEFGEPKVFSFRCYLDARRRKVEKKEPLRAMGGCSSGGKSIRGSWKTKKVVGESDRTKRPSKVVEKVASFGEVATRGRGAHHEGVVAKARAISGNQTRAERRRGIGPSSRRDF